MSYYVFQALTAQNQCEFLTSYTHYTIIISVWQYANNKTGETMKKHIDWKRVGWTFSWLLLLSIFVAVIFSALGYSKWDSLIWRILFTLGGDIIVFTLLIIFWKWFRGFFYYNGEDKK